MDPIILATVIIAWGTLSSVVLAVGVIAGGVVSLVHWIRKRNIREDKLDTIIKQFENNGGSTMRDQLDAVRAEQAAVRVELATSHAKVEDELSHANDLMAAHIKQDAVVQGHILATLEAMTAERTGN